MRPASPSCKAYAGIGSRETPDEFVVVMRELGYRLALDGWTLRSGGAKRADHAFEEGARDAQTRGGQAPWPEVYLPWPSFNKDARVMRLARYYVPHPQEEAYAIAAQFHPAWEKLSGPVRALHARNVHQVLGPDVTQPLLSRFVVCWTKDGAGGGGTGQALRIARDHSVPILDLALEADFERVAGWLRK